MLVDTHCHLDFSQFDNDREEVIKRAKENKIKYIINIGSSLLGSEKSIELAKRYDFIFATVGFHPHEADNFNLEIEERLKNLAKDKRVVAIGEIGLDYFKSYSSVENQKRVFKFLLDLAKEFSLPSVIHCRDAQIDILNILRDKKPKKTVIHCFSGDEEFLSVCLNEGFFISFTCNITYKNAHNLRQLVKNVPLERLMLETDAPFLPPQDLRGKRNEPAYVKFLAETVAELKRISVEELSQITTQNAEDFFNLK